MRENNGLKNEYQIIDLLNEKQVKDLPDFWIGFIKNAFTMCKDNDIVHAYKENPNQKQDFRINMCGTRKTVSVKSGEAVSVHEESIARFCGFLKWLGISEESINFLRLYHYGDGTIDGTGEYRMNAEELNKHYQKEIVLFNKEVNEVNKLHIIIKRFLMLGTPMQRSCVNYLFYGNTKGGLYCDMEKLCRYLAFNNYIEHNYIHFGPFTYAPSFRGLKFNDKTLSEEEREKIKNNRKRYYINIKWSSLKFDLIKFIKKDTNWERQNNID